MRQVMTLPGEEEISDSVSLWTESSIGTSSTIDSGSSGSTVPSVQESNQMFGPAAMFTNEELLEATNNSSPSKLLGFGGYGTVYKGKLRDGQLVAIKRLKDDNPKKFDHFLNEATVVPRIRPHPNLVTLLGCSNPSSQEKELLLVYEFVANGTVEDHLHKQQRPPLSWMVRMQIAIETAKALVHLHSCEPVIIHRDLKTANVLLDSDFHVKVADFRICHLLPWDTTTVSTVPQGTLGSRDPEYDRSGQLTDKSDVYSFGVLLLELITGNMAVDFDRDSDEIFLADMAISKMRNKELEKLIDSKLGYQSDGEVTRMINIVAQLASWCLRTKGAMRPPMAKVLTILNGIKDGTHHLNGTDIELKEVEVLVEAYIFSHQELSKATNCFCFTKKIGNGKVNNLYLGELGDGRTVAVKVLRHRNSEWLNKRYNDAKLVFGLRHKNLVTIHGFTEPQSQEMLQVYEYVPNGTVASHLHIQQVALPWSVRLQIAIETAEALTYLHSIENASVHLNLTTSKILLDNDFNVKVTGVHTYELPNRLGYGDPDTHRGSKFTRMSHVYSFGVVLVELLTGKKPKHINRKLWEFDLVIVAITKIINKEMEKSVDPELRYQSDSVVRRMINSVANLAFRCLQKRPSMVEVLTALKGIKDGINLIHGKDILKEGVIGHFTRTNILYQQQLDVTLEGFDAAYLGNLDGQMVAVEVLSSEISDQHRKWPQKLFHEVMVISHLRHQNLIALYGCTDPRLREMFLVREHASNSSVAEHLHHQNQRLTLGWALRMQIAIETAETLSYLHSLETPVVHCNVATSTIMLDDNFHVKLAGLNLWTRWTTDVCLGYTGYVDPTLSKGTSFKLISVKNDLYSFGVVLLELVSGKCPSKRSSDEQYLVDLALDNIRDNEMDLIDVKLDYRLKGVLSSVAELARRCLLLEASMRPSIMDVLAALKEIKMDGNKHTFHDYN